MDGVDEKSSPLGPNNLPGKLGLGSDQKTHRWRDSGNFVLESEESSALVEKQEAEAADEKDGSENDGVPYDTGWAWVVVLGKSPSPPPPLPPIVVSSSYSSCSFFLVFLFLFLFFFLGLGGGGGWFIVYVSMLVVLFVFLCSYRQCLCSLLSQFVVYIFLIET